MTIELLNKGSDLRWSIVDLEHTAKMLDKANVCIDKNSSSNLEDRIELLPEEMETLESLRQAYLTILRTANSRKLDELKQQFDAL